MSLTMLLSHILQVCEEKACLFTLTSGHDEDGHFYCAWGTTSKDRNHAAAGYTNVEDALKACLRWLKQEQE